MDAQCHLDVVEEDLVCQEILSLFAEPVATSNGVDSTI